MDMFKRLQYKPVLLLYLYTHVIQSFIFNVHFNVNLKSVILFIIHLLILYLFVFFTLMFGFNFIPNYLKYLNLLMSLNKFYAEIIIFENCFFYQYDSYSIGQVLGSKLIMQIL
jgi:hypothetical protein